jgi:hypothetical protein
MYVSIQVQSTIFSVLYADQGFAIMKFTSLFCYFIMGIGKKERQTGMHLPLFQM